MPIPDYIRRMHVLCGIAEIDANGVPLRKKSTIYCIVHDGRHYAPKHAVRRAHVCINGKEWKGHFGGWQDTNRFLERRGFKIVTCTRLAGGCCGGVGK